MIMNNYEELAANYGCKLSKNAAKVIARVEKRNGYCPCRVEENEDTLCPCKEMRENQHCCCGMFINE
jgi:ferredoxin-thioredoxin reductase catalytic subunit